MWPIVITFQYGVNGDIECFYMSVKRVPYLWYSSLYKLDS